MSVRDEHINFDSVSNSNSYTENRQLPEVFEELKRSRLEGQVQRSSNFSVRTRSYRKILLILLILVLLLLIVLSLMLTSSSNSSLASSNITNSFLSTKEDDVDIEVNRHRLNAPNIINSNSSVEIRKEQVVEEREIPFETLETPRATLPKDERVVLQDGIAGKKNVTLVKTYSNDEFTEETILKEEKIQDFLPQIVDVGTSEFLAKIKAHLKDTLYLTSDSILYQNADDKSTSLAEIKKYMDVELLDLPSEDWCKVSYDGIEGYLKSSVLTSATFTPTIVEKNRIQEILVRVNEEMPLNQSSGLTLSDYKKIFTNLTYDTNSVFASNYEAFYNADKNYKINGIFLAAMAIHESNWGTSKIANDKKNLFGYTAYDSSPYESSSEFDTYEDGINLVAKVLVKYYINPIGTKIYDGETAVATYYNGSTIAAVNERYASDEDWHEKVYNYMEILYNRLNLNN